MSEQLRNFPTATTVDSDVQVLCKWRLADIRHEACDTSCCDVMIRESEKKGKADRKHRGTEGNSLAGEFRYSDRQYRCIDFLKQFESLVIRNGWTVTGNVSKVRTVAAVVL